MLGLIMPHGLCELHSLADRLAGLPEVDLVDVKGCVTITNIKLSYNIPDVAFTRQTKCKRGYSLGRRSR